MSERFFYNPEQPKRNLQTEYYQAVGEPNSFQAKLVESRKPQQTSQQPDQSDKTR